MFVLDLLLLAFCAVIHPDPGVKRVFIDPKVTSGLGNGLIRLTGQFNCAFLAFSGICFRRGLAHRTLLVCCVRSLSPCVRKSIATSPRMSSCTGRSSHRTPGPLVPRSESMTRRHVA